MPGTREEISSMEEQVNRQAEQMNQLEKENGQLRSINKKLREEINLLKERLGLNSSNSSLRPSRDLYKQKREERKKSNRNPGGRAGHAFHCYQPMEADEIIEVISNKCSCGHELEKADSYIVEQKIEIPFIKPYVKEYRRWYSTCAHCKKRRLAPLPAGIEKDLLGNHTKAIISALNGHFQNSKREVQTILKDVFNLPISLGLIS
jgi:transposase